MSEEFNPKLFTNNLNDRSYEETLLLNIHQNMLYPPPIGKYSKDLNLDTTLNFSKLKPVLSEEGIRIIIGEGSFSQVFLYTDPITNKKYAVKQINKNENCYLTQKKNTIFNEINIQGRITHPNIIKLYNYFEYESNMYLILEYACNDNLFYLSKSQKFFSEGVAFYYFIQALNAIYFLHTHSIIHRDLKPENLLINENNILKLCDFGWSVKLNNNKRTTFCGTIEYMAPEIIKKQRYDESIDIWSLGVLLYELVHSYSPFVTEDLDTTKIENNIIKQDLKFKEGVSEEFKDLITQLLIKNCEKRIKIEEIYQHPFVLKYVTIMYTTISKCNFTFNDVFNTNKKNVKYKSVIINKSNNSVFDSVPSEQEQKETPYNEKNQEKNVINKNVTSFKKNKLKLHSVCDSERVIKKELSNSRILQNNIKKLPKKQQQEQKNIDSNESKKPKINNEKSFSLNEMGISSEINNNKSEFKITINICNSPKTKNLYKNEKMKNNISKYIAKIMEEFYKYQTEEKITDEFNFENKFRKKEKEQKNKKIIKIPKICHQNCISQKMLISNCTERNIFKSNFKDNNIFNLDNSKALNIGQKYLKSNRNYSNILSCGKSLQKDRSKIPSPRRLNSESKKKFIENSKIMFKKNNLSSGGEINEDYLYEPSVNSMKKISLKKNNKTNVLKIFTTNLKPKTNPFSYKKLQTNKKIIKNVKKSCKQLSPSVNRFPKVSSKMDISPRNNSNIFSPGKRSKQNCKSPNAGYNFYFSKVSKDVKTVNNYDDNRKTGTSSKDSDINKGIRSKKLFNRSKRIINETSVNKYASSKKQNISQYIGRKNRK